MKKLRAEFYVNKGYSHQDRGEYDAAEQCFLKALSILESIGNKKQRNTGMALQHSNLGLLYHQELKINKAIESLKTAINLYKEIDVIDDCAPIYASLGKAYYDNRDWVSAKEALEQSRDIYSQRRHGGEALRTVSHLLNELESKMQD